VVLVETGWWPPDIGFEVDDMATVIDVINEARKKQK